MSDAGVRRYALRRKPSGGLRGAAWCCSFAAVPRSPDIKPPPPPRKPSSVPAAAGSLYSSPSPSAKLGLGLIDPRRILSPGRVSPIDSDAPLPEIPSPAPVLEEPDLEVPDPPPSSGPLAPADPDPEPEAGVRVGSGPGVRSLDLRIRLRGRDRRCLELELDSKVLCESSGVFAGMVVEGRRKGSGECRRIDVEDVEDVAVFREAIELMYEKEPTQWLMRVGVSRCIDILQVSVSIMFDRGVASCLKYLEAVPWSESEEEKLKALFARHAFDDSVSQEVLARLCSQRPTDSDDLAVQLIQSVTNGTNNNARKELQSLVNGLLSKSSVYQKDPAGLNKESLYNICHSCLNSIVLLFKEACDFLAVDQSAALKETKPLVERVSKQVENLNWLLDILIENQIAEDFVGLWANQKELASMHGRSSPMVRYELSRISAGVFIALGKGKIQCRGDMRSAVIGAWFGPMLMDFGWLQRCSKGMDMRVLEDGLGQALLTLPLRQQQILFVEWFRCFAGQGTECPNLSKAFQVWWRRTFARTSSEADA